jgi:hypothetical protein
MNGIASIIAPVIYPQSFAWALDAQTHLGPWPILGAPFFIAAFLLMGALVLAERATRARPSTQTA